MRAPGEDEEDDPSVTAVLVGVVRWAWERDEVEQQVSPIKLRYSVARYGTAFVLFFVIGGVLWLTGREVLAVTFWLIANGLTGFFGAIAVGWDVLELRYERRDGGRKDEPKQGPERELAPDLTLSRDAKISFVVTVVLLLLIAAGVYGARALL